jgi:fission 1 protein
MNLQAQSLAQLIDRAVTKGKAHPRILLTADLFYPEGYIGMALVGGAAAVGTILLASLVRRAVRR